MRRVFSLSASLRSAILFAFIFIAASPLMAQGAPPTQPAVLKPGDNLVVENIPPVPAAIAEKANQYGEFRFATLQDWHPTKKEMLIGTRFADVQQIHMVQMPGGARTHSRFFLIVPAEATLAPKVTTLLSPKTLAAASGIRSTVMTSPMATSRS